MHVNMIYRFRDIESLIRGGKMDEIKTVVKGEDICRADSLARRKDSYVYVFMDPRDVIKDYKLTEDCTLKNVIVYIGRGTGQRVINHDFNNNPNKKVTNVNLSRWIDGLRSQGVEPYVMIYSKNLSKTQSEFLEADLLIINSKLQNPHNGLPEYKEFRSPISHFNKRIERSYAECYLADGKRAIKS